MYMYIHSTCTAYIQCTYSAYIQHTIYNTLYNTISYTAHSIHYGVRWNGVMVEHRLGHEPLPLTRVLYSLMAVGTKDLLNLSVLQRIEMSLPLLLLLCPSKMLWRGCLSLFRMDCTVLRVRLSTTVPSESRLLPSTELAFFTSLSNRLVFLSVMLPPQQTAA